MSGWKVLGILLIVGGIAGLVFGRFSYTKATHSAKFGPLELSVKDKETIDVPAWASVGGIVVGAALLVAGRKK